MFSSMCGAGTVGDATVLGELPVERWRQPFFVVFRGEPGLDAGGVP